MSSNVGIAVPSCWLGDIKTVVRQSGGELISSSDITHEWIIREIDG
ncbi:hypothetical protein RSSM_05018 [Rhodopirellula sallentina SM41]|uniref:Uncharacterized protein n=1 Tax=Rhodopirellula sallentina SM41 TaxID=1263870 RepID=M5TWH4_9BACT|nr:hypothetical protein RSSM_05018 [Rhodopirellula sallentina SM41]